MSHNLIWLASGVTLFIGFISAWLFSLHPRPETEFILIRDPSIKSNHAEVFYERGSFYLYPLEGKVFFNSQEVDHTAPLKEGDQFILGHTVLQLMDTAGWLPRLKVVGYYIDETMSGSKKISIGRSDQPEEDNEWKPNDIVVSDTFFEPIQLWIYPIAGGTGPKPSFQFAIENRGKKSVEMTQEGTQGWSSIHNKQPLKIGDKLKVGETILQFIPGRTGKGMELQILRGRTQTFRVYLDKRIVLNGSQTIPGGHIPNALVDEEFLEKVRRCIEARLIYLDQESLEIRSKKQGARNKKQEEDEGEPPPSFIHVRGFTRDGKLIGKEYNNLTKREQRLLEQVFRFSPSEGSKIRWRRPFNRSQEDSHQFDGTELENFIIKDGELKGIYSFAARLSNPHALQKELSVERGSIYDQDQKTLPRLVLKGEDYDSQSPGFRSRPLAQLLLVDYEDPGTVLEINLSKPLESKTYVASGYIFSGKEFIAKNLEPGVNKEEPIARPYTKGRVIIKRKADQVILALGCSPIKLAEPAAAKRAALSPESDGIIDEESPNSSVHPDYACGEEKELANGEMFEMGGLNFTYQKGDTGLLAGNNASTSDKQQTTDTKQWTQNKASERYYPLGEKLVHIIGYNYARSNFKGNLEEIFDNILLAEERQTPWYEFAPKAQRRKGNDLILTIDDDLQQIIYEALKKKLDELNQNAETGEQKSKEPDLKDEGPDVESEEYSKLNVFRGAAIAINSEGEILASVSIPTYNPNNIRSILAALKESSLDNWNSTFINRAFHKTYPPGSTFKTIMSSLALENKEEFLWENRDYLIKGEGGGFFCDGVLSSFEGKSLGKSIPDFRGGKHGGPLTLEEALAQSCNNAFAFLALRAGREMITRYAERYGFNQQDDFLPLSVFGRDVETIGRINRDEGDALFALKSEVPIPDQELHISKIARMGIGQWEIQTTPLQMAIIAITIGNSGLRPYPHLIKGIKDGETQKITYFRYPDKKRVLSSEAAETLKPMMQKVIQDGTAIRLSMSKLPYYSLKDHVFGKTGTAEVQREDGKKANIAWFLSAAPAENPKLAIAIVIEKGNIISREPVMVARDIWEKAVVLYHDQFLPDMVLAEKAQELQKRSESKNSKPKGARR
jgi:cell division protein FtsI/penicillin-binding protein 2